MSNRIWKLAAGAVLAVSSASAFAQATYKPANSPSNYAIRHPNADFDRQYDARVRLNFQDKPTAAQLEARVVADCVVKRAKGKAGELLGGDSKDPNFEKLQKGMSGKYATCNKEGAAGLPLMALNTALAEQILRAENRSYQPHFTPTDLSVAKAFYASAGGLSMDSLGRCLAVYSPGMVNAVLAQGAGSPGEKQALEALYAETPECGVRKSPGNVPADEQRNALATGLYQWLHRG